MTDKVAGPDGSALSEGLGPLVERLLMYSDIRRNDPRENREALRDLIVGELADELRAVRKAERSRWRELVEQLVACHEEPTCPAVEWAKDMLAGREGPNAEAHATAEGAQRP